MIKDLNASSPFGWWARLEDEKYPGTFWWVKSWHNGIEQWRVTEDPELAYRFLTPGEAIDAINVVGTFAAAAWNVVEHQDEPALVLVQARAN